MKKVLSHGNKYYTGICPTCGCKFEYYLNDIYIDTESQKTLLDNNYILICPECGDKIVHPHIYGILLALGSDD